MQGEVTEVLDSPDGIGVIGEQWIVEIIEKERHLPLARELRVEVDAIEVDRLPDQVGCELVAPKRVVEAPFFQFVLRHEVVKIGRAVAMPVAELDADLDRGAALANEG